MLGAVIAQYTVEVSYLIISLLVFVCVINSKTFINAKHEEDAVITTTE